MTVQVKETVVRAAQAILRTSNPNLVVDGHWGDYTSSAYRGAPTSTRLNVDAVLSVAGISDGENYSRAMSVLKQTRDVAYLASREKARLQRANVDVSSNSNRSDIIELITKIAIAEGVPPSFALKVAKIESNFNPKAKSSTGFKGLFQISRDSLTDAYRMKRDGLLVKSAPPNSNGERWDLVDYYDPIQNTLAGLRYLQFCKRFAKVGWDREDVIYIHYNIGIGNAAKLLTGRITPAVTKAVKLNPIFGSQVSSYAANVAKELATIKVA